MNQRLRATLYLLNSSVLVAFSGDLRIYIAFILTQAEFAHSSCLAGGLVIYTVYTLDRALECEEDSVNRSELTGSRRDIALFVSLTAFVIGTYLLSKEGLCIISFLPFVTGYLYSKGVRIGSFELKLKGGLGIKNLVVGLTWGTFITGVVSKYTDNTLPLCFVFMFFSIKLFINSVIYDFKDVKGDALAGIKTLPLSLGEKKTIYLLLIMHLISHTLMYYAIMLGFLAFEPVILFYSYIGGVICILFYAMVSGSESKIRKYMRLFLIDGESITIVGLRTFTGSSLA